LRAINLIWGAAQAISLLVLIDGWRRCTGLLRQRMAWIALALGVSVASSVVDALTSVLGVEGALFGRYLYVFMDLSSLLSAALLGYAVLRHRVFDFGLVVQHAVVVSLASGFVLVLLAGARWVLEQALHETGGKHSALYDLGLGMLIVVLFARVQSDLTERVHRLLFRRWHAQDEALRHAVAKAAHVIDADVLRQRVVEAVDRFVGHAGNALYAVETDGALQLRAGTLGGAPPWLAPDDEAAVELRLGSARIALAALSGSVLAACAEFAFPMSARGRPVGLLVIGPQPDGQAYREDQLELLAASAQRVGLEVEGLRIDALERENRRLREALEEKAGARMCT
jgi:hypothetical protein